MKDKEDEEELHVLFQDELPDKLTNDLLALAHLSDVEESQEQPSGPVRRSRNRTTSKPYEKPKSKKKSEAELLDDEIKELDFRTRAWKPFQKNSTKKS